MAQTVSDLHADGLVGRRPDPLDGRQILIELTDLSRQALTDDRRRRDGWLAHAIATELTSEERARSSVGQPRSCKDWLNPNPGRA